MPEQLFSLYIKPLRFRIEDDYIEKTGRRISVLSYKRATYAIGISHKHMLFPLTGFKLANDDTYYVVYKNIFWLYYYFYFKPHQRIVLKSDYPELLI